MRFKKTSLNLISCLISLRHNTSMEGDMVKVNLGNIDYKNSSL